MSSHRCVFCDKQISSRCNLLKHLQICKKKDIIEIRQQLQTQQQQHEQQIQTQQQQLEQQIQTQQQQHEQQIQTQQQQHEQQIQILKSQYEKEIQILKEQLDEFKNQIFEIAKQPKQINNHNNSQTTNTHNNQRIMNITNQLIPMNLSDSDLRHLVTKYYTTDTFLGGPESIAQMTVNHILIDQETGKFRVVCTDTARGIFYFQDADNNLIRDIGMQKIQEKLIAPLNEATLLEFERLEGKNQMDSHRLLDLFAENLSCIRGNELPNRVKKNIQLPITNPVPAPSITIQEQ